MQLLLRRSALLLISVLLASVYAQDASRIKNAVTWRDLTQPPASIAVGDIVTITLEATVQDGFHIYSGKQPSDAILPATFDARSVAGLELVGPLEEEGHREVYHDQIFDADIAQYTGKVVFRQQVKITALQASLAGALSYQVCDDQMCIPGTYPIAKSFTAVKAKKGKRR